MIGIISYHLQSPHTPNPDFDLAFNTLHIVQLNTFPPAAASRLAPEQQKFLGHANSIVVGQVAPNISAEFGQGKTANNCLVGLCGTVAPLIFAIKSTASQVSSRSPDRNQIPLTRPSASRSDVVRLIRFPRFFSTRRISRLVSRVTDQLHA